MGAYALAPAKFVQRIFFFPTTLTHKVKSSSRYIPFAPTLEKQIENYVNELALGPHMYSFSPILPKEGRVDTVMYRDHNVYINFNRELAFAESGSVTDDMYGLIQKNIIYNFPNVHRIFCMIDGQSVYETPEGTE